MPVVFTSAYATYLKYSRENAVQLQTPTFTTLTVSENYPSEVPVFPAETKIFSAQLEIGETYNGVTIEEGSIYKLIISPTFDDTYKGVDESGEVLPMVMNVYNGSQSGASNDYLELSTGNRRNNFVETIYVKAKGDIVFLMMFAYEEDVSPAGYFGDDPTLKVAISKVN